VFHLGAIPVDEGNTIKTACGIGNIEFPRQRLVKNLLGLGESVELMKAPARLE
jgi:hypothetical protein